jgi:integrase
MGDLRRVSHPATSGCGGREALGPSWPHSGYTFTTPIDPRNCTRVVQLAVERAGLPKIRLHDLRHGCAGAPGAGSATRTAMDIVGHSTLEMTMMVYGHVSVDDQRAALDQLDLFWADL